MYKNQVYIYIFVLNHQIVMKNLKIFSVPFLCVIFTIYSCTEEEEIIIPANCSLEVNFSQIIQNTESFTNIPISPITGNNGTSLSFTNNSFSDIPYQIDITDTQNNNDMLLMGYPTIDSDGGLLISAGICFISAYDIDGNLLTINNSSPPTVNIPNSTNAGTMNVYSSNININDEFVWIDNQSSITPFPSTTPNEYQNIPINSSGGVNMDIPAPSCISTLNIKLPLGYNGNNSSVNIYFNNQNSSIIAYDGDVVDGNFEINNIFCVGDEVQFVLISQIDGIKEYYVSPSEEVSQNSTWIKNIYAEELEIALCADALRLLVKEQLE